MPADPGHEEQAEREVPCGSQEEGSSDMDQTEQQAPGGTPEEGPDTSRDSDDGASDPVSSSSSTTTTSSSSSSSSVVEESSAEVREEGAPAPSSSTPETPTEGATEGAGLNTGTSDEPMDQDLSVVPTKCTSSIENIEIRSVTLAAAEGHLSKSVAES